MTTKKNISLPGDFIIDKIFKEYGSKDFYKTFKDSGYNFASVTKRWQEEYMNGVGITNMIEFFEKIYSWKPLYEKKFKDVDYDTVIAHILPICAPTFFEQVEGLTDAEKEDALEITKQ